MPKENRTSKMILVEIEETVASIDGISTGDALKLGRLIQEYGSASAGEVVGGILAEMLLKPKGGPSEPWKP